MAREIKFRGENRIGKWIYGFLGKHYFTIGGRSKVYDSVYVIFQDVCQFDSDNFSYIVKDHSIQEETIGQFTGMYDKNGKEIYEGDIVEAWSEGRKAIGEVRARIDGLWMIYPAWQNGFCWTFHPNDNGQETVEVIGNIHDNPELLKGE